MKGARIRARFSGRVTERDATVDLARELLARGQTLRYVARGTSMWPAILDGDRLTLAPLTGEPRLGEVLFLPTDDFGIAHRLVGRWRDLYCLKGDNRANIDGWFQRDDFAARVVAVERDGRAVPIRTGLAPVAGAWLQSVVRGVSAPVRRGLRRRADPKTD